MSLNDLKRSISNLSKPFQSKEDLRYIVDSIGDSQFVLLGEASHGTSEFYSVRAEITKMLIQEKGFKFIGVEGDWPACFTVNQYLKKYKDISPREALKDFNRWPTWMWANEEVLSLIQWLYHFNQKNNENIGFYGLDVYSLWESMEEILRVMKESGSIDIEAAKKAFSCFEPFDRAPEYYGVSAAFYGEDCTDEVVNLLLKVRRNQPDEHKEERGLNLAVNSLVTLNAEAYYRAMVKGGPDDWNIRDHHMVSALEEVVNHYGSCTKAIIWEHNTHIGDARATDMEEEGLENVGQILREKYGQDRVFSVGFGTYKGTVIAARKWGEEIEKMVVPNAKRGSWEEMLHESGAENKILVFNEENRHLFNERVGHRAIGVVYNPEYEHLGNYVPSQMSERYDAFIFIDETNALRPLAVPQVVM